MDDKQKTLNEARASEQFELRFHELKTKEGLSLKPEKDSIPVVESYVEEQLDRAGVGMKELSKVNIAVDEIYSNIVLYSGADMAEIICDVDDQAVTVVMKDNGVAYNPLDATVPDIKLSAEERAIGGLGIFMTYKLMTEVLYDRLDGKNVLLMRLER